MLSEVFFKLFLKQTASPELDGSIMAYLRRVMALVSDPLFFALILSFLLFSPSASLRRSRSRARYTGARPYTGVWYAGYCTPDFHYLRVSTMRTLPSITYFSLSVFLVSVCSYSPLIVGTHAPRCVFKERRLNRSRRQGQRDSLSIIVSQLMGEEK